MTARLLPRRWAEHRGVTAVAHGRHGVRTQSMVERPLAELLADGDDVIGGVERPSGPALRERTQRHPQVRADHSGDRGHSEPARGVCRGKAFGVQPVGHDDLGRRCGEGGSESALRQHGVDRPREPHERGVLDPVNRERRRRIASRGQALEGLPHRPRPVGRRKADDGQVCRAREGLGALVVVDAGDRILGAWKHLCDESDAQGLVRAGVCGHDVADLPSRSRPIAWRPPMRRRSEA